MGAPHGGGWDVRAEPVDVLRPALAGLVRLRRSYESWLAGNATEADCDSAFKDFAELLRGETVVRQLGPLLQAASARHVPDRQAAHRVLTETANILKTRETELAKEFGFTRERAVQLMNEALRNLAHRADPNTNVERIASVTELLQAFSQIHLAVSSAIEHVHRGGALWRWKRRRDAKRDIETQTYAMGCVVADGLDRPAFELSYAITYGLAQRT